jgi:hypothetical protein
MVGERVPIHIEMRIPNYHLNYHIYMTNIDAAPYHIYKLAISFLEDLQAVNLLRNDER